MVNGKVSLHSAHTLVKKVIWKLLNRPPGSVVVELDALRFQQGGDPVVEIRSTADFVYFNVRDNHPS